jgi:flagellar hook-length control protein FliK
MVDTLKVGVEKAGSPAVTSWNNATSSTDGDAGSFADILIGEVTSADAQCIDATEEFCAEDEHVTNGLEGGNSASPSVISMFDLPAALRLRKNNSTGGDAIEVPALAHQHVPAQDHSTEVESSVQEGDLRLTSVASITRRPAATSFSYASATRSEPPNSLGLLIMPSSSTTESAKPDARLIEADRAVAIVTTPDWSPVPEHAQYSTQTSMNSSPPLNVLNSVAPAPASVYLQTPLYDKSWAADFSQQIVVFSKSDVDSAYIKLNPAELGPIQVTLDVLDGQASASFVSSDERVRLAIEAALGDLKDALAKNGVALTNTFVGSQSTPDRQNNAKPKSKNRVNFTEEQIAPSRLLSVNAKSKGIDVFA